MSQMGKSNHGDIGSKSNLPSIPSAVETFRYPFGMRLSIWFAPPLFAGLALVSVYAMLWPEQGPPGWDHPAAAWIFSAAAVLFVPLIWYVESRLTTSPSAITSIWFGCNPISIEWSEIRRLYEKRDGLLIIHGRPGDPVVKVYSIIEDYARLRDIILRAAPRAAIGGADAEAQRVILPMTFRRELLGFSVGLSIGVLMVALATWALFEEGLHLILIVVMGLGLFFSAQYGLDWYFLTVDDDKMILMALGRSREIRYSSVLDLEEETSVVTSRGQRAVQTYLCVKMLDGKNLRLKSFRNQTLRIRHVIENAPGFVASRQSWKRTEKFLLDARTLLSEAAKGAWADEIYQFDGCMREKEFKFALDVLDQAFDDFGLGTWRVLELMALAAASMGLFERQRAYDEELSKARGSKYETVLPP